MGIKRMEDFTHDVQVHKDVLASMPINNQKNLKLYKAKVAELRDEYSGYKDQLYQEIKKRSSKYLNMEPSSKINQLKKDLLDYKDLSLYNPINTAYEKLGLDNILYSLNHFFKNDLATVNSDIKKVFDIFSLVDIELTEEDFIYSSYARYYIHELLQDDDIERMKDIFEDLHWKCPDVILHIEMCLRILFNKNIKKFEQYLSDKKREALKDNLNFNDYLIKKDNLEKELLFLENYDGSAIISKFMNGTLILNEYSKVNVDKCYSKFLGDNVKISEAKNMNDDFKKFYYNLDEYKNFLKYTYILDDVKKKYAERSSHLDNCVKIEKDINSIIEELIKLNDKVKSASKKSFFIFKKKINLDQVYVEINEKIKELDNKYNEYDNEFIYKKMNEELTDTSSIFDVFKFVLSFKGYLRKCIKTTDESMDIDIIKQNVKEFDMFLNNPNLNVLKNVKFIADTDIALMISDHYKLLNINTKKDDLTLDNIDNLLKDLNVIINNYYLESLGLDINFILELFESKKIIDAKEKAK